ncbi:spermidine/putrescine ABC transporter permease [Phenylobacterium sp. Root77]|uniref:ABC transporter permease n=1 Tax=unclassified Phenylobacterium TaxID=2640670 RepID=UPI0006FA9849|nr:MULTISPECIES: ABC transporter permease subunit [unclassified Phenylobacterium]KQW66521.1 spermidine/putrescine ABC transporter permease [Phenylobacterium sp. Root1277]KQW89026.1 spermidine/putrescine ABC transporter permease [Phenylobacterium sp. Root1290]KRC42119.1 spermidine/putrescine ABC transporter permease [Phenylobacterium sp. Root77]
MSARRDRTSLAALAPLLWLGLFFLFPFLLVAKLSLSETTLAMPPYAPRLDWSQGMAGLRAFLAGLDFETYARLTTDRLYIVAYLSSLKFAAVATFILLLIGYPLAYAMARCPPSLRSALLMAMILPFWTSFLIRVYALIGILKPEGLLNVALRAVGLGPVSLLNTDTAIYIGLVYAYLPFMVLPLYAVLERQQHDLLEAAADLGCAPFEAFWRVTFPLSLPGVAAGSLLCFIPMVGEFVIPDLLGGSSTLMLGKTIWTEFFANRDWPAASAVAIVLLFTLVIPIVLYQRQQAKLTELGR